MLFLIRSSTEPDEILHSAESHLGLHCLLNSGSRHKWINMVWVKEENIYTVVILEF